MKFNNGIKYAYISNAARAVPAAPKISTIYLCLIFTQLPILTAAE